jgi:hypothetical protein
LQNIILAWIFSHELYPVECAGDTKEEVMQNYPLYLKEFIKHRLHGKLSPLMEGKTQGHGGRRVGAGRPQGSKKEAKVECQRTLPIGLSNQIRFHTFDISCIPTKPAALN